MNPFNDIQIAQDYDSFYYSDTGKLIDKLEKQIVENILEKINPCIMLELGCGTGHWTSFFSEKGFDIIGIDISEAMLEIASSKKIRNAKFQLGNAEQIPFCFNSFSLTAAITLLEFTTNPHQVLKEIYRVTKPSGNVILGFLNSNSFLFKNINEKNVLKNAKLYNKSEILNMTNFMGKTTVYEAVYADENKNILDFSTIYESAFIALHILVEK